MANVDVTRIASNIGALNALNSLQNINKQLATHQTRLSTGKQINSAADDPAGLTIATKMLARSEGLKVAISNIGDASNMLSVAEAGMSKINDILVQMRSKAEQAASDTLGSAERGAIQTQLSAYSQQINDLVDQTKWNGVKLLDQSTGTKQFQTGADEGENVKWSLTDKLDPSSLLVSTAVSGNQTANAVYKTGQTSFTGGVGGVIGNGISAASGQTVLATGGYSLEVLENATSATEGKIHLSTGLATGLTSFTSDDTNAAGSHASELASGHYQIKIGAVSITTTKTSMTYTISNLDDSSWNGGAALAVTDTNITATNGTIAGGQYSLLSATGGNKLGVEMNLTGSLGNLTNGQTMDFEYIKAGNTKVELNDSSNQPTTITRAAASGGTAVVAATYSYVGSAAANYDTGRGVQIAMTSFASGRTVGDTASFDYLRDNAYSVDVSSADKAAKYMTTVNGALDKVSSALANLGSLMARMTFKEDAVTTAQVNVESAYSRIMNANMAEEQMNASKFSILQQTATAMLAQANTAPQSLLTLFR